VCVPHVVERQVVLLDGPADDGLRRDDVEVVEALADGLLQPLAVGRLDQYPVVVEDDGVVRLLYHEMLHTRFRLPPI